MPLSTKTEGLQALEKEKRAEWVERRAKVAKDLYTDFDGEGDCSECLAKLQPVVPLRGFGEIGEPAGLRPLELA